MIPNPLLLSVAFSASIGQVWSFRCKCVSSQCLHLPNLQKSTADLEKIPTESCWPTASQWTAFNRSLAGKLIADTPPALPCYPGPMWDAEACAAIDVELTNQAYVSQNPIALSYPTDSCPPINASAGNPCTIGDQPNETCPSLSSAAGHPPGSCSIGDQPVYTVNASQVADVTAGINFARQRNIRLVLRNTGHDILRRYAFRLHYPPVSNLCQIYGLWKHANLDSISENRVKFSAII